MDERARVFGQSVRTIAEWSPEEKQHYLAAVSDGVSGAFRPLSSPSAPGSLSLGGRDAWEHADHQFGFFGGPGDQPDGNGDYPLQAAGLIAADANLDVIDVRLDRLRVYDYPGRGPHHVLLTFKAINVTSQAHEEAIAFSQTFIVPGGQGAGVLGYPIFLGLNVGQRGANFAVGTINVKNGDDERALAFLDSGAVQQGLSLLKTAQPALAPFTDLAINLGRFFLSRHKNVSVQQFFMGLDRQQGAAGGARLRTGSYAAIQGPQLTWPDWVFNPQSNRIVSAKDRTVELPLNYLIFRVS